MLDKIWSAKATLMDMCRFHMDKRPTEETIEKKLSLLQSDKELG
jgi:hypothetical protein